MSLSLKIGVFVIVAEEILSSTENYSGFISS
jgi:hypothetical protein